MDTPISEGAASSAYPVRIHVDPRIEDHNRLTTAFRIILAIPHLILVGGPMAATVGWTVGSDGTSDLGGSGGLLGLVAVVCAVIAWFAILFTGRYPEGLRKLVVYYLRWRLRAVVYTALLRDEYPPFGEGPYPASLELSREDGPRNRLTVAFRIILAIPHLFIVWALSIAWALTSVVAWFAILFTGRYPPRLYDFALGVLGWNMRVEAYLLLLHDDYPPFSFA